MKHFIKDMKLALIEANRKGLSLDVLSMVLANYEELEAEGYGELGTQALIRFYDTPDTSVSSESIPADELESTHPSETEEPEQAEE